MYRIEKLEWDSNHFSLKIGNVVFDKNNKKIDLKESYDIAIAKVEMNKIEEVEKLQNDGFVLKDTLIRFSIESIQKKNLERNKLIFLAKKQDLKVIKEIAKNSFRKSHFYKNKDLEISKIDALYEKWILNKFEDKNNIYIYKEEDIIKGFLLAIENQSEAKIDLIAVDSRFKGKGIGKELILNFFQSNISKKSYVGTQITNIAAMKLYEKVGYKIFDFTYIFHKNNIGE